MSATKPMTLRPGLLVALRTSIDGGVEYHRAEEKTQKADATETVEWKTTRIIENKDEYERAKKARSAASHAIRRVCSPSSFGLLCPASKADELERAYTEALDIVDAFNGSSETTRVSIHMLKGRIEASDELAVQAIGAEVRGLLDEMKGALAVADVKRIRDAADSARKLGQMLDEGTAQKISKAVEEARSAAKAIVKRVENGGEDAALVIQELSRKAIDEARFAFLDMGEDEPAAAPAARSQPTARSVEV